MLSKVSLKIRISISVNSDYVRMTAHWLSLHKLGYNLGICSVVLRGSNNTRYVQTAGYKVSRLQNPGRKRLLFRKLFGLYMWRSFKAYKVTFQNGTVCRWWHHWNSAYWIIPHCNSGMISWKLLQIQVSDKRKKQM